MARLSQAPINKDAVTSLRKVVDRTLDTVIVHNAICTLVTDISRNSEARKTAKRMLLNLARYAATVSIYGKYPRVKLRNHTWRESLIGQAEHRIQRANIDEVVKNRRDGFLAIYTSDINSDMVNDALHSISKLAARVAVTLNLEIDPSFITLKDIQDDTLRKREKGRELARKLHSKEM